MLTLSRLVIRGIDVYQRVVSPRKGYRCAYSVLHGGSGCSGMIRAELSQRGLLGAFVPTLGRFAACAVAYRTLRTMNPESRVQGFCCCNGIPIPLP